MNMRTTLFVKRRHNISLLSLSRKRLLVFLCIVVLLPIFVYYLHSFDISDAIGTVTKTPQFVGNSTTLPPTVDVPIAEPMPMETISLEDADPQSFDRPDVVGMKNFTQLSFNLAYEAEWRQHPHLVVYGVLATDKAERRAIRAAQRSTWLRYPDVATRWNAFKGLMLVLYPAAPFALVAPNITVDMMKEMDEHHDVLMLRMREEAPTKNKVIGQRRGYGLPMQVSNARKRLLYLLYAHHAFPTTPFIAKGDDDSYVYVPEYMRMVRQLPRINVVYGTMHTPNHNKQIRVALGYSYLVTRDVVRTVMSNGMVPYFLRLPFIANFSDVYVDIAFHHEDWTVGATLHRLYGSRPSASRSLPSLPPADDRLPPVEGWGMHYMEYVFDYENVAHTGRSVSTDGRYDVTYTFPPPNELKPGNVLFVDDKCRINNQRLPNATAKRLIVAHRPTKLRQFRAYWEYHHDLGEDLQMERPGAVEITNKVFYSDAELQYPTGGCNILMTL